MTDVSAPKDPPQHAEQCIIYATAAGSGRFKWGWRSSSGSRHSAGVFLYFYECMVDAQNHGYAVDVERVMTELRKAKDKTGRKA